MDSLKLIAIATHVADARSCVLHPASHTHRQLSDEQLREAGIAPDLIRLSVGIESADDIIADLRQALDRFDSLTDINMNGTRQKPRPILLLIIRHLPTAPSRGIYPMPA